MIASNKGIRNSVSKQSSGIGGTISIQNSKVQNKYEDEFSEKSSNHGLPIRALGATITSATTVLEARKVFDNNSSSGQLHADPSI